MADRTRLAGGCASMSSRRKCDLERERESSKMASRLDCCSICHRHLCFGGTVVSITTTNINAGQCPALTCLCSELRLHRILRKDSQLYRDRFLWRYVYTLIMYMFSADQTLTHLEFGSFSFEMTINVRTCDMTGM